ncbi:MAG: AroB: 3-dehydroquinate synthase, partial [Verrucomicrobiota bacterium]
MNPSHTYLQNISVHWEFPVVFTHHLFAPSNPVLLETTRRRGENRKHRCMVYVDSHVLSAQPELSAEISAYFHAHPSSLELAAPPQTVPAGEASKNSFAYVETILRQLLEFRMDRQSYVIVVGGGAVLDAIGFAAALVHRGLRLIRVPTTVLAQNDAGVG